MHSRLVTPLSPRAGEERGEPRISGWYVSRVPPQLFRSPSDQGPSHALGPSPISASLFKLSRSVSRYMLLSALL